MANYKKIVELRPEMADFFGNRRLIGVRGDVLCYWANTRCASYSTDAAGFRHSTFAGKEYSLADCLRSERYGIVMGASNLFGFGIAGNENCMASQLAERFRFPFANAAMPGANSRNLHSLLVGLIAGAPKTPEVVIVSNGGDLSTFCEASMADPIFGSPNRALLKTRTELESIPSDPDENFPRLLAFTSLWTTALAMVCQAFKIRLILIHQSTFFEKKKPAAIELQCGLGEPFNPSQKRQFANHRKFDVPFYEKRKAIADAIGVPLAGWGMPKELSFMDEFHADLDGMRAMTKVVGDEIESVLKSKESPAPVPVPVPAA